MIDEAGRLFRVTVQYNPYFYVQSLPGTEERVARYIASFNNTTEDQLIEQVTIVEKEDLAMVYSYLQTQFISIFTFSSQFHSKIIFQGRKRSI